MALDLSVIQEVVIDDSKSVAAAQRVVAAQERMTAAADKTTAATQRQAQGLGLLDAAVAKAAPAQDSAIRRLNMWKAAADPNERVMQRLARAEADLDRARKQGLVSQEEQIRVLGQLEARMRGAVMANDNFSRGTVSAAGSARGIGMAFQQAGYQVGDFAVQVASGQGVLRPLIQQGTQLISMFGPWGAVIGAAGAVVGALAVGMGALGDSTDTAEKAQEVFNEAIDAGNELLMTANELTVERQTKSIEAARAKLQEALATQTSNYALAQELKLRMQERQQLASDLQSAGGLARNAGRTIAAQNDAQGLTAKIAALDAQMITAEGNVARLVDQFVALDNPANLGSTREEKIKRETEALKDQEKRLEAIRKNDADLAAQQDKDRLAAIKRGEEIIKDDAKRQAALDEYILVAAAKAARDQDDMHRATIGGHLVLTTIGSDRLEQRVVHTWQDDLSKGEEPPHV